MTSDERALAATRHRYNRSLMPDMVSASLYISWEIYQTAIAIAAFICYGRSQPPAERCLEVSHCFGMMSLLILNDSGCNPMAITQDPLRRIVLLRLDQSRRSIAAPKPWYLLWEAEMYIEPRGPRILPVAITMHFWTEPVINTLEKGPRILTGQTWKDGPP